jgi:hypothetical protein
MLRLSARSTTLAFLTAAFIAVSPGVSRADTWSLGVAGGYAGGLKVTTTRPYPSGPYTFESSSISAPGTAIAAVQLLRALNQHFSFAGQVAYLPYGHEFNYDYAHHVPIAFGIRYTPVSDPDRRGIPYVELNPALVWTRWRTFDYGDARRTSLRPGLIAGLGLHGKLGDRVAIDLGLRYFLSSSDKGQDRAPIAEETLEGMRQGAILFGLYYTL